MPGIAQQEAYKLSMLAREGEIRLPTVYGLILSQHPPYKELLLMERLRGLPVEALTRKPERWQQLQEQIVDGILAWHRIDSHGLVGPRRQYTGKSLSSMVFTADRGDLVDPV